MSRSPGGVDRQIVTPESLYAPAMIAAPPARDSAPASAEGRLDALRHLVSELLEGNDFWRPRLQAAGLDRDLRDFAQFSASLPLLEKREIVSDQRRFPPYGSNLTYRRRDYVRLHQTSGTSGGVPLRWLDTSESWGAMLGTWRRVFEACGVGPDDRVFFPFSFGPFLGFWTAFDASGQIGCLALPGGGLSSRGRLDMLLDNDATVVCCTPTYALRLAEVATEAGLSLARDNGQPPRKLIVAGEPGGSVPAVRRRLVELWRGVEVFDHHGMTEVGPVSYPDPERPSLLRVDGRAFFAEVLDPKTGAATEPGELGELVLTTLRRVGSPLLRYRTGDVVRPLPAPTNRPGDLGLDGGLLSRADDMVVVRGVNLYPSAFDRVIRRFEQVSEYRVTLRSERSMAEVSVEIEPVGEARSEGEKLAAEVAAELRATFNLRIPVTAAAPGSLPRFELKAKRWRRSP